TPTRVEFSKPGVVLYQMPTDLRSHDKRRRGTWRLQSRLDSLKLIYVLIADSHTLPFLKVNGGSSGRNRPPTAHPRRTGGTEVVCCGVRRKDCNRLHQQLAA